MSRENPGLPALAFPGQDLRGGVEGEPVEVLDGALGRRVEGADRRDSPVLVLDPHRRQGTRREDIRHLSSESHLARLVDPLVRDVAQAGEGRLQRLGRETLADRKRQLRLAACVPGRHPLDERVRHRHDDRAFGAGCEPPERRHAPAHGLAGRRGAVVREAVPGRNHDGLPRRVEPVEEAPKPLRPALAPGHDHEAGRSRLPGEPEDLHRLTAESRGGGDFDLSARLRPARNGARRATRFGRLRRGAAGCFRLHAWKSTFEWRVRANSRRCDFDPLLVIPGRRGAPSPEPITTTLSE
jgi:hypothetical protein